jgi:tetratricopeptide (TPR) repeat protein
VENDGAVKAKAIIDRALDFVSSGQLEKGFVELNKAEAFLDKLEDSVQVLELKANCCEARATAYKVVGSDTEASRLYRKAVDIRVGLEFEDKESQDKSYSLIAMALVVLGDVDGAAVYADKILDSYNYEDGPNVAMRFFSIGQVYIGKMDKYYKKAKKAFFISRSLYVPHLSIETVHMLFEIQKAFADIAHNCEHDDSKARQELERAWGYAEKVGIGNCKQETLNDIALNAMGYSDIDYDTYILWSHRLLQLFGQAIDKGVNCDYSVIRQFVLINVGVLMATPSIDESLTIERALKCAELMKSATNNIEDIALAQWLAGTALAKLGTTREEARKAIRLIKLALQNLKNSSTEINLNAIALGEGYIADYHFQKKEYDLAEEWYQKAKKSLSSSSPYVAEKLGNHYSACLAECAKHL